MTNEPDNIDPENGDVPRESARTILFQFVVFPLAVVLVGVGIFFLFGVLASEEHSVRDYVSTIRTGSPQRRWQAAYQLSKSLQRGESGDYPDLHLEIESILAESDDPMLRRYLTLVLGNIANPASVPAILRTLDDDDVETRVYALWALAEIGDASAVDSILPLISSPERDVRKTAAYALGRIGSPVAIPSLVAAMKDPVADVRWNAAIALARLDDERAVPMLREMLDRKRLDEIEGFREDQKENAMIAAMDALVRFEGSGARDLLEGIAEADPNLRVRSAAKRALQQIESAEP